MKAGSCQQKAWYFDKWMDVHSNGMAELLCAMFLPIFIPFPDPRNRLVDKWSSSKHAYH